MNAVGALLRPDRQQHGSHAWPSSSFFIAWPTHAARSGSCLALSGYLQTLTNRLLHPFALSWPSGAARCIGWAVGIAANPATWSFTTQLNYSQRRQQERLER